MFDTASFKSIIIIQTVMKVMIMIKYLMFDIAPFPPIMFKSA